MMSVHFVTQTEAQIPGIFIDVLIIYYPISAHSDIEFFEHEQLLEKGK